MIKKIYAAFTCWFLAGAALFGTVFFEPVWQPKTLAWAATENLDELMARKPRLSSATWGYAFLENSAQAYTWQPETLMYKDVTYGSEVWKLTNTPSGKNETQDISTTHWSANGKRLIFHAIRPSGAFWIFNGTNLLWMLVNTDGSRLRPPMGASALTPTWDPYPAWSTILDDVLYQPCSNDGQSGTLANTLYKLTVSDAAIARQAFLTLPGTNQRISLKKAISGDGRKLQIRDVNNGRFFPATVYPEAAKGLDSANGYPVQLPYDWYWGYQPPPGWTAYHDQFMAGAVNGADGIWNYVMPENTNGSWWRARLLGSGADGQPVHGSDHAAPYAWGGELEPVNTFCTTLAGIDPWNIVGYVSHFCPDRWARYGIFSKSNNNPLNTSDPEQYQTSLIDLRNHTYWNAQGAFGEGAYAALFVQHHDWDAWSDWSASDGGPHTGDMIGFRITTQNYKNPNSQRSLALTHTRENGNATSYEALPRPTQSPDGTKILFNSTFLNNVDDQTQLFWVVAYYPYPPEIKSAAQNGSAVRLTWDFNQGTPGSPNTTNPRTYATRGWPHETTDLPPSPREIDQFRVWASADNAAWSPLGTTVYNNSRGTHEGGTWTETAWTYDAVQPAGSTRYYALTSLEYSGLESRTLSNVWKVVTDGSGNLAQQAQQTAYPANPGGQSGFYTTAPQAPQNIQSQYQRPPATASGQYTVSWQAPAVHSLIRYYNIYAADGVAPAAVQQDRIASVPASSDYANTGVFSYVDWAGEAQGSTHYTVTAVDFQGNESVTTAPTAVPTPTSGFAPGLEVATDKILAYPNPSRGKPVAFACRMAAAGELKIHVFNVAGRPVACLSGTLPAGPGFLSWDVTRVPAGIYFCQAEIRGKKQATLRIAISK